MTTTKQNIGLIVLVSLAVLTLFGMSVKEARATPSQFFPTKETAPATSTLLYLTPGTGTTTLTYDSFQGDNAKIDRLVLAMQYTGSSTGPTLKIRFEDSMNNNDWYPRSATSLNPTSTTTLLTGNFSEYQWTVSTTTDNGGSGTAARVHNAFTVEAPMRYVRAIFYVPAAGGNGGLWAQFVPVKQKDK